MVNFDHVIINFKRICSIGKNQPKNYLKLGILLLGVAFMTVGCLNDDLPKVSEETIQPAPGNSKIVQLSRKDIAKNPKVVQALSKLEQSQLKRGFANKTILDTVTGLEINTDYARYLEHLDGSYHSYTFFVTNTPEGVGFENVLLSLQPDGSYKEFLIQYDVTDSEIDLMNSNGIVEMEGKVSITELAVGTFGTNAFSRVYYQDGCWYDSNFVAYRCCSGKHVYGQTNCTYIVDDPNCAAPEGGYYSTSIVYCSTDGGDGNPPDPYNPPPDPNGNGNGGTGTNDPPDESAVLSCSPRNPCFEEFDPIHESNCDKLHKLSTSANLQNEFNFLNNQLEAGKEKGYALVAVPFAPGYNTPYLESQGNNNEIVVPRTPTLFAFMHVHPNNVALPMFGPGDVNTLFTMAQDFAPDTSWNYEFDTSTFTVFMTVSNYVYAIKIDDLAKLIKIHDIYQDENNKKAFIGKFEQNYKKTKASSAPIDLQNNLAKDFLKFMKDFDLGVSLYRSHKDDIQHNPNLPANEQSSNWTKMYLDTSGSLKNKPCN